MITAVSFINIQRKRTGNGATIHLSENWKRLLEVHLFYKRIKCSPCKWEHNAILIIQIDCSPRMIYLGYNNRWTISTGQWIKTVMNSVCTFPSGGVKARIPIS